MLLVTSNVDMFYPIQNGCDMLSNVECGDHQNLMTLLEHFLLSYRTFTPSMFCFLQIRRLDLTKLNKHINI